jgi:hypothetical protein
MRKAKKHLYARVFDAKVRSETQNYVFLAGGNNVVGVK